MNIKIFSLGQTIRVRPLPLGDGALHLRQLPATCRFSPKYQDFQTKMQVLKSLNLHDLATLLISNHRSAADATLPGSAQLSLSNTRGIRRILRQLSDRSIGFEAMDGPPHPRVGWRDGGKSSRSLSVSSNINCLLSYF